MKKLAQQLEQPQQQSKEQQTLIQQISQANPDEIKKMFEVLSMMIQAFEGKDLNPDNDVITRLIDVKNILERSNFPSMPVINFQVYCRLVAKYHPELIAFEDWANFQAEALKSLGALSSEQYVEMMKAQNGYQPQPSTTFGVNIGGPQQQQQQQKKRGWFGRNRQNEKQEEFKQA